MFDVKTLASILAIIALPVLAGCTSSGSNASRDWGLGDGFRRSSDTLGTQRRMDVYGGATAPVLPTMGMPGYGK